MALFRLLVSDTGSGRTMIRGLSSVTSSSTVPLVVDDKLNDEVNLLIRCRHDLVRFSNCRFIPPFEEAFPLRFIKTKPVRVVGRAIASLLRIFSIVATAITIL